MRRISSPSLVAGSEFLVMFCSDCSLVIHAEQTLHCPQDIVSTVFQGETEPRK